MASFLDGCRFTAVSTGTVDFVVSTAPAGYKTPASAQAVDGAIYKYRAESADLSQWEEGYGAYTVSSTTLARTTVLFNSSGTTAKISFTAAPQVAVVAYAEDLLPIDGALFGLTLSTAGSSATFTTAAGWAADSTAVNILRLYSSLAKTTSAWAVGAAAGSLDTGAVANSTWYHVYIIKRLDTGVTDILTSLSATAPTMPTNYTLKRRIGSMKTNGSAQWTSFTQEGDIFTLAAPVADVTTSVLSTTSTLFTLPSVPTGFKVEALITWDGTNAALSWIAVHSPDLGSPTAAAVGEMLQLGGTTQAKVSRVLTNTSGQVKLVSQNGSTTVNIRTLGWVDTRGRFA